MQRSSRAVVGGGLSVPRRPGTRFRSRDGQWVVDLIRLSGTGDNRDGERFRVLQYGFFVAEARDLNELSRYVDLAELEDDA
jgi:hypothetical protein